MVNSRMLIFFSLGLLVICVIGGVGYLFNEKRKQLAEAERVPAAKAEPIKQEPLRCCWCKLKNKRGNYVGLYRGEESCESEADWRRAEFCKGIEVISGKCSFLDVRLASEGEHPVHCEKKPVVFLEKGHKLELKPPLDLETPCDQNELADAGMGGGEEDYVDAPPVAINKAWKCEPDFTNVKRCHAYVVEDGVKKEEAFHEFELGDYSCTEEVCLRYFTDKFPGVDFYGME